MFTHTVCVSAGTPLALTSMPSPIVIEMDGSDRMTLGALPACETETLRCPSSLAVKFGLSRVLRADKAGSRGFGRVGEGDMQAETVQGGIAGQDRARHREGFTPFLNILLFVCGDTNPRSNVLEPDVGDVM